MLESLTSEKAGKKSLRFDLKEGALQEFEMFHKNSFFFPNLLNFSSEWALNRSLLQFLIYCKYFVVLYTSPSTHYLLTLKINVNVVKLPRQNGTFY